MPERRITCNIYVLIGTFLLAAGCTPPDKQHLGPGAREPGLKEEHIVAHDGFQLPLHRWAPEAEPKGIVLGLHGFNDHGGEFFEMAKTLTMQGFSVYAYDQRGFGKSEPRGIWPGQDLLMQDTITAVHLLHERYPEQPVYLMGRSMGASVIILAVTAAETLPIEGSVLIAPAVWSRETMPWYQRFALWAATGLVPGMSVPSGVTMRLGIQPTDDEEVLERWREDPTVQRYHKVHTLDALTAMMGDALDASSELPGPTLILYGTEDHIVPERPICHMLERLPDPDHHPWQMGLYPGGYHLLTRYSEAEQVHEDIIAWMQDPAATSLPSGHEVSRNQAQAELCD